MDTIERRGEFIPPKAPASMLKSGKIPVLRAIHLLWGRMGRARFYVLAVPSLIILLAIVGVFHLTTTWRKSWQSARGDAASNAQEEFSRTMPLPAADDATPDHSLITITDVASEKSYGQHGQTRVDVKIGVTPQANVRNGQVEIRVFFYDVTPRREIRPTRAQVTYQWLTRVRDWSIPSPKFLVATYLGSRKTRRSFENVQYGGFIVRVYFDGHLQDEKSDPEGLLASLRSSVKLGPDPTPKSPPIAAAVVPSPSSFPVATTKTDVVPNTISPSPATAAKPSTAEDVAKLPYARPVPGKPGFVYSPYDEKFLIDVRGAPPGTVVNDPNAGKAFRVP